MNATATYRYLDNDAEYSAATLTAPAHAQRITVTLDIIDAQRATGSHWLDNVKVAAVVVDARDADGNAVNIGRYVDMRSCATNIGAWFVKRYARLYDAYRARMDVATTDAPASVSDDDSAPDDALNADASALNVRELRAALTALGADDSSAPRAELRSCLSDAQRATRDALAATDAS
jgi:hypothetical protein